MPIDYFVVDRRGEQTLARLLLAIRRGEDPARIPTLAIRRDDGSFHFTPLEPEVYDPTRHRVRWADVPDDMLGRSVATSASSGCPLPCAPCNFHAFENGAGTRTMDMLVPELRQLQVRGYVDQPFSTGDILFVSRRHMRAFCERLRDEGLARPTSGGARVDLIEVDDAAMLADGGGRLLSMGHAVFVFSVIPFGPIHEQCERFGPEGMHYDWRHDTMDVAEAMRQFRWFSLSVPTCSPPIRSTSRRSGDTCTTAARTARSIRRAGPAAATSVPGTAAFGAPSTPRPRNCRARCTALPHGKGERPGPSPQEPGRGHAAPHDRP